MPKYRQSVSIRDSTHCSPLGPSRSISSSSKKASRRTLPWSSRSSSSQALVLASGGGIRAGGRPLSTRSNVLVTRRIRASGARARTSSATRTISLSFAWGACFSTRSRPCARSIKSLGRNENERMMRFLRGVIPLLLNGITIFRHTLPLFLRGEMSAAALRKIVII